jgi:sodium transport system permease protein
VVAAQGAGASTGERAQRLREEFFADGAREGTLPDAADPADAPSATAAPEGRWLPFDAATEAIPAQREALETWLRAESGPRPDLLLLVESEGGPLVLLYDSSRARSSNARERMADQLEELASAARREALGRIGQDLEDLSPLRFAAVDLSSREELGAFVVSLMLPMMIVVMALMGAFYPAVDLTAGERERRTEETTLLAPVPRLAVLLGKLLAVAGTSSVATAMNLLGMGLAAGYLLGLLPGAEIDFRLQLRDLLLVTPFALAFVAFVSAVSTAVASLAETFKQGQSLLGLVQMVFILPAMATSLPGLELTPGIAATPVVGAAIAFRTVLRGGPWSELPWDGLALAFGALLLYASLAVWLALRLLGHELSTGGETPSTLRRLRRALGAGARQSPSATSR